MKVYQVLGLPIVQQPNDVLRDVLAEFPFTPGRVCARCGQPDDGVLEQILITIMAREKGWPLA